MLQPTVIHYNTGENTETILNSSILKQKKPKTKQNKTQTLESEKEMKKKPVSP